MGTHRSATAAFLWKRLPNDLDRFGFKAIPGYLPGYMSLGDRYETDAMTSSDLQKVGAIWMLSWEDFARQVHNRELTFDVLNFSADQREVPP